MWKSAFELDYFCHDTVNAAVANVTRQLGFLISMLRCKLFFISFSLSFFFIYSLLPFIVSFFLGSPLFFRFFSFSPLFFFISYFFVISLRAFSIFSISSSLFLYFFIYLFFVVCLFRVTERRWEQWIATGRPIRTQLQWKERNWSCCGRELVS